MSHQEAGTSGTTSKVKTKDGAPYRIERRTKKKRGSGQLSGYALDITIRVNGEEAYFLQDHSSTRNVMPHNNRKELVETLLHELERNHIEHFGHP
jgi:hypothetical protein